MTPMTDNVAITNDVIDYFKKYFNVDVSNIKIINSNLNTNVVERGTVQFGEHSSEEGNVIKLDVEAIKFVYKKNYKKWITIIIVHELTHWMQSMCNKGCVLAFAVLKPEDYYTIGLSRDYANRPLEIDATLSEVLYLYHRGNSADILTRYAMSRLKGVHSAEGYIECLPQELASILLSTANVSMSYDTTAVSNL